MKSVCRRGAFTLTELLVSIAVVVLLIDLALPAIQHAREIARARSCQSRLRQISLAMHNYHAAFGTFPMQGGGTADLRGWRVLGNDQSNHHRLNCLAAVLPYLELQPLWEQLSQPRTERANGVTVHFPAMGPVPWYNSKNSPVLYGPWNQVIAVIRCPSDPATHAAAGETNYGACMGDGIKELGCAAGRPQWTRPNDRNPQRYDDSTKRGMFANWRFFDFASCTDGTSQTLLLGEIGVAADGIPRLHTHVYSTPMKLADDPHKCFTAVDRQQTNLYKAGNHFQRGGRWADAGVTYSGFNTVLPPNSPSCVEPPENGAHPDWFGGVFSVGSFHAKGAHLTFVDGSVRFIGQSVNCETSSGVHASAYMGSVSQPGSESPYGVWGAMGTRGCADSAEVP